MKIIKSKSEIYFILVYFLLLTSLFVSVGLFNYYGVKKIQNTTLKIYKHPLKVSNAALNIKQKIYQIHSEIKSISISKSKEEIDVLSKKIKQHENDIYKNLTVIKNNILLENNEKLDEKLIKLFKSWKITHDEIIELVSEDRSSEAQLIIKGKCNDHIHTLEKAAEDVYKFAQGKALEFKNSSISKTEDLKELTKIVNLLFFITLFFILFFIIKKILKHKRLENVLNVVRKINQSITRENDAQQLLINSYNILKSSDIYECLWVVVLDDDYKITNIIGKGESRCYVEFQDRLHLDWKPVDIEKISKTKDMFFQKDEVFKIKIKYEDKLYGFFNVCFKSKNIENDERLVLEELASDIAYAIRSINLVSELEQNEQRYHMLFQGNKTVELIIDPSNLKIVEANDKACGFYGYNYDELKNMSISNICILSEEEIFKRIGEIVNEEYDEFLCIHRLKNGEIRNVKVYSGPINVDGKILLYSIIFDISDSLRIEKERDLVQKRLELVLEATYDGIWDWDLVTDEIYFSPRAKSLLGYKDYEIENKLESWISRIHPDDKEDVFLTIKDMKEGKLRLYKSIHRMEHKDKSLIWIEARGKIIFDKDNRPVRVIGSIKDISSQKEAEDTILYLKNLYDNIINSIENVIFVKNKEFKYITCNDSFLKLVGKSRKEDVIGKSDFELVDNETAQIFRENDKNMFVHKKPVSNFEWVTYPNGDNVYLKTVKAPLFDSDKNIIGLVGNSADFTREHELYKRLKEAQSISKIGSWEYNLATEKLKYSDELRNIYGFSDLDIQLNSEDLYKCVHPSDLAMTKQTFKDSLISKETTVLHNRIYRNSDGKLRFLEHRWIIENENDKVLKLVGITQDITEKKSTLVQLEQKKIELETIVKEAPNPIIIHNEEGQILSVNKAWSNATGYTSDEIETINEWIDKAYDEKVYDKKETKVSIKEYINTLYDIEEKVDVGEYIIKNKNGDFMTWQFSSAPLGVIDEQRTLITLATDITELKKKDEMLMKQSRSAAMGEMIGMIAHQWRQPISAISMDANNMLLDIAMGDFDTESSEKYANSISEQTQHLSKTIDDFRNFFKPDRDTSIISIQDVFDQTLNIVEDTIKNNDIELITVFDTDKKVNAYPRELMQVFVNMIQNSKDAILFNKKENGWISIHVYDDGKYVNIEFSDNGGGIYDDILSKIFDPYFSTKDEKTGTGLGLYMSKMIIEEHLHGKIEVYNIGEGTCFKISLLIQEDSKDGEDE